MRRSILTVLGIVLMCVVLARPHYAVAAVNEDFDSYTSGTLAEDLTTPGVSFDGSGNWYIFPVTDAFPPFINLTGQTLVGIDVPLMMTFTQPQNSYDFLFAIGNFDTPDNLNIEGFLNGTSVFTDVVAATPPIAGSWPEGNASGSGIVFDQLVIQHPSVEVAIDNLVTTDAAVTGLNVPHVTQIRIDAWSPITPYDSPDGSPARLANGDPFLLPQDYDGNGFDTHIVTETVVVDGATWYAIFIGSENFVWVRDDQVQVVGPNPQ